MSLTQIYLNKQVQVWLYESSELLTLQPQQLRAQQEASLKEVLLKTNHGMFQLQKDVHDKPWLIPDGPGFSVTHSRNFLAVIFSTSHLPGIDLEFKRNKMLRVLDKFASDKEKAWLAQSSQLEASAHIIWCAKEAIYKSCGLSGTSFKNQIEIDAFSLNEKNVVQLSGTLKRDEIQRNYTLTCLSPLEDSFLVFTTSYNSILPK